VFFVSDPISPCTMTSQPFTLRIEPEVTAYIAGLPPVARRQVERDLEKLASRGMGTSPPLVGKAIGGLLELRSAPPGHGVVRLSFYRDGETSFHVFFRHRTTVSGFLPGRKR
jgi:hypothetical protein